MTSLKDRLDKFKPWSDIERNTHISLRNQYIYFQVSKSASSTVKYYLQYHELLDTPWENNVIDVNKKQMSPHLSPFQLGENKFERILDQDRYKKITFVRNPYARLLSCYLHRICGSPNSKSSRVLCKQMNINNVKEVSFEDFIFFICTQNSRDMESHWRVQYDEVMAAEVKFDFVGKQESMMSDIEKMLVLLYGKHKTLVEKNKSPMRTGAKSKVLEYYSPDLAGLVASRFKEDFEEFGYSYDLTDC